MGMVVQIIRGPRQGLRFDLRTGASVLIGSARPAGWVIDGDDQVAAIHLSIQALVTGPVFRAMSSGHPVLWNGNPSQLGTLRSGDELKIGQTVLRVIVDAPAPAQTAPKLPLATSDWFKRGGFSGPVRPIVPTGRHERPTAGAVVEQAISRMGKTVDVSRVAPAQRFVWACSTCAATHLCCFTPATGGVRPVDVLATLHRRFALTLILNPVAIGPACKPEDFPGQTTLMPDFPPELREVFPFALPLGPVATWKEAVQKLWGRDALLIVLSKSNASPPLTHLQRAARFRLREVASDDAETMFGYYMPSVARVVFANGPEDFTSFFLGQLDGIAVETEDGGIKIYSTEADREAITAAINE